jgi:hypothetical protein
MEMFLLPPKSRVEEDLSIAELAVQYEEFSREY